MRRPTTGKTVRFGGVLSVIVVTASSAASYAQEPPPPAEAAPSVSPNVPAPPPPAPPPPPPPPAPVAVTTAEPPVDRGPSDLDVETRRWAIGYAGLSQVPVGAPTAVDITVPAIGVRYWTGPTVGLDFAVGVGWSGGSIEAAGMSIDKDSITGFLFQFGLPLALSTHRHVSFQVIPYMAVAHGQTTTGAGTGATPMDFSGTRVDVGARAGFELFFGFIGIPELALSATIGMQIEYRRYTVDSSGFSQSDTTTSFSTTVQNNPWDIFAGNVAARYYF